MIVTVTLNPCVDHTLFVTRIGLHETNRVASVDIDAGGKGINAARVIANLGGETLATGLLGGANGAFVRHVLENEHVPHSFTQIEAETRLNFSVEDRSGEPPTCFNEPGPTVTSDEVETFLRDLAESLRQASWLHVDGSAPPGMGEEIFTRLGELARANSVQFAVDADGKNLSKALEAGPHLVKPNVAEASSLLDRPLASTADILKAAAEIRQKIAGFSPSVVPVVVVSRGADGAVMADAAGLWVGRSPRVAVRSTVGSGDSMVGAILTALDSGMATSDAFALGLAAGATTAEQIGSDLATRRQTEELLQDCQIVFAGPIPQGGQSGRQVTIDRHGH